MAIFETLEGTVGTGTTWFSYDTDIIRFFNSGFNGAISPQFGNLLLIVFSLLLSGLFAGFIGFEREYKGHDAGLRTHLLVGVGSALVMVISIYGFGAWDAARDPARLAAQVVTGVGFLGAGAILNNGFGVKGLTTAATIWTSMAIGLAIGSGNFIVGSIGFVIAFISLIVLHRVDRWIAKHNPTVMLVLPADQPSLKEIIAAANRYNIFIRNTSTELLSQSGNSTIRITIFCTNASKTTIVFFADELRSILKPIDLKISA